MEAILSALADWSQRIPDRLAVCDQAVSLTYRQLAEASDFAASLLTGFGLKPGDITVFMGSNGVQRVVAYLGFLKAGVTMVFLDPRNPSATWKEWAGQAGAIAMVRTADCADIGGELDRLAVIDLPLFGVDAIPHVPPQLAEHSPGDRQVVDHNPNCP